LYPDNFLTCTEKIKIKKPQKTITIQSTKADTNLNTQTLNQKDKIIKHKELQHKMNEKIITQI